LEQGDAEDAQNPDDTCIAGESAFWRLTCRDTLDCRQKENGRHSGETDALRCCKGPFCGHPKSNNHPVAV
jgi:hypothetical protein